MRTCDKKTIKFMYRCGHVVRKLLNSCIDEYIFYYIKELYIQAKVFLKAISDQESILYLRFLFIKRFFQFLFI